MNKVALEIIGLSYSESQTGAYVLILGDKNSQRRLPIVIGGAEAQSIAMGLERTKPNRPLTHDLFVSFAYNFNVKVKEVVINRFRDGVFYCMMVCEQNGELTMIDCRPSDAIAIAVRYGCDIYVYETVMEEASIVLEEPAPGIQETEENNTQAKETSDDDPMLHLSLNELEQLLQTAIDEENYSKAAFIRDEIQKRKGH